MNAENTEAIVDPKQTVDPEELGNAIGSTEPTVEEQVHWTPEMREVWKRDQLNDKLNDMTQGETP